MFAGVFAITFGVVVRIIGPCWAANTANKFRQQVGSEIDPNSFKLPIVVLGLAAIVFGIVGVTKALR